MIVYLKTRSCLPSPYVFPDHLDSAAEAGATGATAAMAALIAGRPTAILVAEGTPGYPRNLDTEATLGRLIASDYHLKATLEDTYRDRKQRVFVRNDLR